MSKFYKNDRVVCIQPLDNLEKDGIYTIKEVQATASSAGPLLLLEGISGAFLEFRFKLHKDTYNNSYIEADGLPQGNELSRDKQDLMESNVESIVNECQNAMFNWPEFHSAHEGFAVLAEEVDELWEHVKTNHKKQDISKMKTECIQIAAMALRFATEICDTKKANN